MASFFSEVFEFTAAVRGFHVYRKTWRPKEGQVLNCYHEKGNSFDPYAIKVCEQNSNDIVGHLPREISRITKFMLHRGAFVNAELTSRHYRRSPLVQGGLEIKCKISVKTNSSFSKAIFERYKDMVKELYIEPKEEEILGSFLLEENIPTSSRKESTTSTSGNRKKAVKAPQVPPPKSKDIRSFFTNSRNVKSKRQATVIDID